MESFHKLLQSQIEKNLGNSDSILNDNKQFFDSVNNAFSGLDSDLELSQSNLELRTKELHQANSDIRSILQASPSLFFRIDSTGAILEFIAGRVTDIYFPSDQVVGKKIQSLHSEDVAMDFEEAIRKVRETDSIVEIEFPVLVKQIELFYKAKLMPALDDMLVVVVQNITKSYRVENSLKESTTMLDIKNRYVSMINAIHNSPDRFTDSEKMFEQTVDAIIENMERVDYTGIYIVEGKEAVLKSYRGYPKSYIKRASVIPVPRGYNWKTILEDNKRYCADAERDEFIGPAGVEAGIKTYYTVPLHYGDKVIGTISINSLQKDAFDENDRMLLDTVAQQLDVVITSTGRGDERRNLMEELESKNAEMERFSYTVSHDLKSPLITIKGFLGMLEQDVKKGNEERASSDIKRINEAADKMASLLDEVLKLSRIGRVVSEPEIVPLEDIINDALSLVSGRINERGVRIEVYPDLPVIFGDRQRFTEVFQNLIDNAVKYMGDQAEPSIEIGIDQNKSEAVCYVKDNGMGIDFRYKDKVFELFNMLNQRSEGTGIGLTVTKRIIELHGGRIWVESEGKGKGSTFYFNVPLETRLR